MLASTDTRGMRPSDAWFRYVQPARAEYSPRSIKDSRVTLSVLGRCSTARKGSLVGRPSPEDGGGVSAEHQALCRRCEPQEAHLLQFQRRVEPGPVAPEQELAGTCPPDRFSK